MPPGSGPRAQPRGRGSAFVLAPPRWLLELGRARGLAIERAAAFRVPGAVLVRVAGPDRAEVLELPDDAPARVSLREGTSDATKTPLAVPPALAPDLARFHARIVWLAGEGGRHAPSARERSLAELARRLGDVRSPTDAAHIEVAGSSETERALALYLAVVRGDVRPLLSATDEDVFGAWPRWLASWLALAAGDVSRLSAHAEPPPDGEGVLEIAQAAALAVAGLPEAALRALRHVSPRVLRSTLADVSLAIARLERELGRPEAAAQEARRALLLRDEADLQARAITELIRCGSYDDAHAWLSEHVRAPGASPSHRALALTLAELLLWASRPLEAGRLLDAIPPDPADARLSRANGIRHALSGAHEAALAALSDAHAAQPADAETRLWLAEVELVLGRRDEALRHTRESLAQLRMPVHELLDSGLAMQPGGAHVPPALAHLLAVLGEDVAPWREDPSAALLRVLRRFGGNRSAHATLHDPSAPGLGLRPFTLPRSDATLSARDASASLARAIGTMPLEQLERRFGELVDEYPESPHPLCYWGEVDLWLGETERAIARFEAALERAPARWAYVGRAAAHVLLGQWREAEAALAALPPQFPPVEGATTPVYVGEMWRRRGEPRRAIAELSEAVRTKPGRIGAWMNLALAHHALAEAAAAEAIAARIEATVPRLLWDAWRALGEPEAWPLPRTRIEPLYEQALALMRGNRSSHTLTYFDHRGTLRVARPLPALRAELATHAPLVAMGLVDRIASGLPE